MLLNRFFPLIYEKKQSGEKLEIKINLKVKEGNKDHNFYSDSQILTVNDLPEFEEDEIRCPELLTCDIIKVYYRIDQTWSGNRPITLFCIDNRTVQIDLQLLNNIPESYEVFLIFKSDYFSGQIDDSRQKLKLKDSNLEKILLSALENKIANILEEKIPEIRDKNIQIRKFFEKSYPHLYGYFDDKPVGIINKEEALEKAQRKFFKEQKELLECRFLDDEKYNKALDISSRLLTEYILYRTMIINKLKEINSNNTEADIHNLIIPQHKTFTKGNIYADLYKNNVWLLDDKYMSYSTILSDEDMSEVIKAITLEDEVTADATRPDITLVFSGDPEASEFVDVIVVELKKRGLKLAKNEEVFSQLKQRARKLLAYYPNKIERIWFYGISDIDKEFRRSLKETGFKELFSHGQMFYKNQDIIIDDNDTTVAADMYILSYKTFISDAEIRNKTFLEVLKNGIKKSRNLALQ